MRLRRARPGQGPAGRGNGQLLAGNLASLSGIRPATAHQGLPLRAALCGLGRPLVFDHPAASAARATTSMKPTRGHPAPRLQAGHLAHVDALDTTGECARGLPHSRRPAIMDRLRMASSPSVPAGQPQPVKVPGHAKTGLTPSSGSRVCGDQGMGRSGRTHRPGHRPARDAGTARVACCFITWVQAGVAALPGSIRI